MQTRNKIRRLVFLAIFAAIEITFALTPIGYVPIGPIRATTLHIPVILAGILLGKKDGAIIGFIFGLTSLMINTFEPTITSFVFSPFISIGGYSGNLISLFICLAPRILLGYLSGLCFELLNNFKKEYLKVALIALFNTVIHTSFVMSMIYFFFGSAYASAKGIALNELANVILAVVFTNGVLEAILAAFVVSALYNASRYIFKNRGN